MGASQAGDDFLNAWTPRALGRVFCFVLLFWIFQYCSVKRDATFAGIVTGGVIMAYTAVEILLKRRTQPPAQANDRIEE